MALGSFIRWAAFLVGLTGIACAQLTPEEKSGLEDSLIVGNLSLSDLQFERKPFKDPYRLRLVDLALDKPLEAAEVIMKLHATAVSQPLSRLLASSAYAALGQEVKALPRAGNQGIALKGIPADLAGPIGRLVGAVSLANTEIREALGQLTAEEKRSLIDSLPPLAAEEPGIKFDFVKGTPLGRAEVLKLLEKVDLARICAAGVTVERAIEAELPALKASTSDVPKPVRLKALGVSVIVCGRGDDIHTERDAGLTIDLGGNNTYTGRHASGVGAASVLIDLGERTTFAVGDLGLGVGLMGVGIARISAGDCVFRTGSLALGAGLAGMGVVAKEGGSDLYTSKALCQGFGMFGVGMLVDTLGDDKYDCKFLGQGAGRTRGVGWQIDRRGNDIYRAGGLILNSPLFKTVHYSEAQGFGTGFREDTGGVSGGVGMLTDLGGDDAYLAETYAQAASYWFSLGTLYDAQGSDTYSAYHYAQASAMHCTAAYLFDLEGDDAYAMKYGAAHAIGHDYGVSFLLDRKGNDIYAARDSSPGIGNANGLGIFIDSEGDDRYQGPPGKGNPARGTGSLGVFADLGGHDQYRDGLGDAEAAATPQWGVAYDRETKTVAAAEHPRPKVTPGSLSKPSDADLERIYAKASQWGVGTAQLEVADNLDRLVAIGLPAFEWMLDRHLKSSDRLQQRAFVDVMNRVGTEARLALSRKLISKDVDERRNALGIAIDGNVKEASPALPMLIREPELQLRVARAAGAIGGEEVVPELLPLAASPDAMLATAAMVSIAQIGSEQAYGTAEALATSTVLPLRKAALQLMAKFPLRGIESAKRLATDSNPRSARIGTELLGLIGTPEALDELGHRLLDPDVGVRIQALLGLNGRCPVKHRAYFLGLATDPIPIVRAVAARTSPGR